MTIIKENIVVCFYQAGKKLHTKIEIFMVCEIEPRYVPTYELISKFCWANQCLEICRKN
jgi:hypothetical protein